MPAGELSQSEMQQYARDGFIVVRDLLSETEVERFVTYEAAESRDWRGHLDNHKRDEHWRAVATHPTSSASHGKCFQINP